MDVIDTIQDYKKTARSYMCPLCRDREYTIEATVRHDVWLEWARPYRVDKSNGTGAYAVLRKKTIKQEEADDGKMD